jgi:NADH-quinone oxidoreductase subunit J
MTLELAIFIIVAAVAIFSAAFMLVSRNAVHSALFLVTNFLCVAFFYLMLNAPFLGMIQVTVYAGAIMVLFMFVIMLLGAERLRDEEPRYPWLAPGAVALTTIFLVVAFVSIVRGNVGLLKPIPHQPQVRFVHAAPGAPAVDVYLNNEKMGSDLAYREPTEFTAVRAGDYNALVFPACTEADQSKCPDPIKSGTAPVVANSIRLEPDTTTTVLITSTADQKLFLMTVPTDMGPLDSEDTLRLTAVNALPSGAPVSLIQLDPAKEYRADLTPEQRGRVVLVADLGATTSSGVSSAKTITLNKGDYLLAWQRGDERLMTLDTLTMKPKTHELLILAPEMVAGQTTPRLTSIRLKPVRTEEAFGSPQQIGQSLLSAFLLPFELVSLLLLVAMVGAIILTREEVVKRARQRLVVSPVVRRINRAVRNPSAESSAD